MLSFYWHVFVLRHQIVQRRLNRFGHWVFVCECDRTWVR